MHQNIWFHKYRIMKLLGKGGTSKVYLAEHIKLNSQRVIKCISKNHPLYHSLMKEVHILKNLRHSCIPIIYDIEENEECSCIIEQYCEGETLKEYIQKNGGPDENTLIYYTLQICDLIQYLHSVERPVLYLDLKPENIIINRDSLKLIDFGSAIYLDELKDANQYTGTRGYAAPELYQSEKIDERSEVYSLGMLMFYMLTGIVFHKDISVVSNIDFYRNCSKQLKDIINRCLNINPSLRYNTVNQLKKQLSILVKRFSSHIRESGHKIRLAVAGSQSRIGVTHFALQLCSFYTGQKIKCLYIEKNTTGWLQSVKDRFKGLYSSDGVYDISGLCLFSEYPNRKMDYNSFQVCVEDYGCLVKENINEFLQAQVKVLILGAKDWELSYAEQVLDLVAEYKDIYYLFNFTDGRKFKEVVKNMDRRNCYRIPYEANPYNPETANSIELLREITHMNKKRKISLFHPSKKFHKQRENND